MNHTDRRQQGQLSRRRLLRATAGTGLSLAGSALSAACDGSAPSARDASPARVYRVGWLAAGPPDSGTTPLIWPSPLGAPVQRLVDRLAELGYVEGRTLHWEYRSTAGAGELAARAAELVELGVDLILVTTAPDALRAAFQAPGNVPVVMVASTNDPVADGYAQSLARPGGKVTGVLHSPPAPVINAKRLEVFKEVLPTLTRLGILLDVSEENPSRELRAQGGLARAAESLGLEVVWAEVRALEELDGAYAALARAGAQGALAYTRTIWSAAETTARIYREALGHRLAMFGPGRASVVAGALVSYWVDPVAMYGRTAEYVDKVLRGARPADLPIETPSKFDLTLNLTIARTLGLTIPPAVMARATEVIQ